MQYNGNKKYIPINRNRFINESTFNYEVALMKSYMEQDVRQTVVLYSVDLENTNLSEVYKEAKMDEIRFKPPVEIPVLYTIDEPELKAYNQTKELGTYMKTGKLQFNVLQATLDELKVEIKRGDYIGVQVTSDRMEYFTVTNDGSNNYDNQHTMYGYKPYYRTISCSVVDPNEFRGI